MQPKHPLFFIVLLFFISSVHALTVGTPLPELKVTAGGAIILTDKGDHELREWSTANLLHSKRIIQYIPARLRSGTENLRLNDAAFAIDNPTRCRTTSIVNYTDAMWGTHMFIESEMAKNKKRTPLCDVVLDKEGLGLKLWGLSLKTNATIVIDEKGIIEFFHVGKLSEEQMQFIIQTTNPPELRNIPFTLKESAFKEYQ